jgi:hypothetical protein
MYQFFQKYGMIATAADLERQQRILGRKPRSFDTFVAETVPQWKSALPRAA